MQITVVKEFTFDAAHWLPGYHGPCGNLHGHTYRLMVGTTGTPDPETGMVVDFSKLKKVVWQEIEVMDHSCLNDLSISDFPKDMPTAENMVMWIRDRLFQNCWYKPRLTTQLELPYRLTFIRLYETPTSYAEWRA